MDGWELVHMGNAGLDLRLIVEENIQQKFRLPGPILFENRQLGISRR
jgi:hypothetical protein